MSDCSCVWVDDYDGPEVYWDKWRKARKTHKCCECGEEIKKGDHYEEVTGIWDGSLNRYRTCVDCVSVRQAFFCDGWLFGTVWEDLYNHLFDCSHTTPVVAISKLTPKARNDVCEIIEELWEKDDV